MLRANGIIPSQPAVVQEEMMAAAASQESEDVERQQAEVDDYARKIKALKASYRRSGVVAMHINDLYFRRRRSINLRNRSLCGLPTYYSRYSSSISYYYLDLRLTAATEPSAFQGTHQDRLHFEAV